MNGSFFFGWVLVTSFGVEFLGVQIEINKSLFFFFSFLSFMFFFSFACSVYE